MLERRSFLKNSILGLTCLGGVPLSAWLGGSLALPNDRALPDDKPGDKKPENQDESAPKVEVVFCLDTTDSMGGLIEGTKQKIWAICNQIAGGKPSPDLKVGLVAYRDRGDEYVTKVFDLSEDLD